MWRREDWKPQTPCWNAVRFSTWPSPIGKCHCSYGPGFGQSLFKTVVSNDFPVGQFFLSDNLSWDFEAKLAIDGVLACLRYCSFSRSQWQGVLIIPFEHKFPATAFSLGFRIPHCYSFNLTSISAFAVAHMRTFLHSPLLNSRTNIIKKSTLMIFQILWFSSQAPQFTSQSF